MTTEAQEMRGQIRKIRGNLNTRLSMIRDCCPDSEANRAYVSALELAIQEIDIKFPTL